MLIIGVLNNLQQGRMIDAWAKIDQQPLPHHPTT